jgi:hypothetical protein
MAPIELEHAAGDHPQLTGPLCVNILLYFMPRRALSPVVATFYRSQNIF